MQVLIVGLGIGQVYKEQCIKRGFSVVTLDQDTTKNPSYSTLEGLDQLRFDLTILCIPNYLHRFYIESLAPISKLLLVEKPGLKNDDEWRGVCKKFNKTSIIMVKNNYYRPILHDIQKVIINNIKSIKEIRFNWKSKNRIPFPGGWFTNKEKAFGGVSYDIMPHLLSFFYKIFEGNDYILYDAYKKQKWKISQIESTEYGKVNTVDPIYNVDDYCRIEYRLKNIPIILEANWKDTEINEDQQDIEILFENETLVYKFGLCPNEVYGLMIDAVLSEDFCISKHYNLDLKILRTISQIKDI